MIPFRPTLERVWLSLRDLHLENRSERGYEVVMSYDLYVDMVMDPRMVDHVDPMTRTVFGAPIRIDPRIPRGWIHLRHEVVR